MRYLTRKSIDAFYRFSALRRFIRKTGAREIRVIVDIGANIGDTLLVLHHYFPRARIIGFEPITEYFKIAQRQIGGIDAIELYDKALSSQHLFYDELGKHPRLSPAELVIVKASAESGPGWKGGSTIVSMDDGRLIEDAIPPGYEKIAQPVEPMTLRDLFERHDVPELDLLKIDCEGCEHSLLGCADSAVLQHVRYITGEYHCIDRFCRVMQGRLSQTHKIFFEGTDIGFFFAERRDGDRDGILRCEREPIRLGAVIMERNLFNPAASSWLSRSTRLGAQYQRVRDLPNQEGRP